MRVNIAPRPSRAKAVASRNGVKIKGLAVVIIVVTIEVTTLHGHPVTRARRASFVQIMRATLDVAGSI